MTVTIASVGFKGGIAKTSSSMMIAYTLAKKGYNTLLVDMDAQANLTGLALRTKLAQEGQDANTQIDSSLMKAVQDKDLTEAEIQIMPNLALIGSSMDFSLYPDYMETKYKTPKKRVQYFSTLLDHVASKYDFCIIDTPPSLSLYLASALYAADYALCLMKTDTYSLEGLDNLLQYIQNTVINEYKAPKLQPLGILPVMLQKGSLDKGILEMTKEKYGADTVLPIVLYSSRMNRYGTTGVTDHGYFDKKPHEMYEEVTNEILKRVNSNGQ